MPPGTPSPSWDLFRSLLRRGTPLFALELRAHSRQWRTYVIRAVYIGLLMIYVVLIWQGLAAQAAANAGDAAIKSLMADVGQRVTDNVLGFQFIAGQVAAIALMCTAFADELVRGRLPTLLTTPLTAVQVVAGKYLSRLVQLLVVMAATLPVLAVVRVFGGVPWLYLLGGTVLSLAAALLTAACTLLFALKRPQPHQAALRGALTALLVCVGALALVQGAAASLPPGSKGLYVAMACGSIGLLIGAFMVVTMCLLEFPQAVRRAIGDWRQDSPLEKTYIHYVYLPPVPDEEQVLPRLHVPAPTPEEAAPLQRVHGQPLVWKATRRLNRAMGPKQLLLAVALILAYAYGGALTSGSIDLPSFHLGVLGALMGGIALWCGFLAACSVTIDKETGHWPLLLSTPLDDVSIFMQKLTVILKRCWLLGAGLLIHVLVFVMGGVLHPLALIQLPLLAAWEALFVIAVGTICSARCRTTLGAVVTTGIVLAAVWMILPLAAYLLSQAIGGGELFQGAMLWASASNPFTQLVAVLSGSIARDGRFMPMTWHEGENIIMPWSQMLLQGTLCMAVHAGVALWLIASAVRSFRRRVYE